MYRSHEELFVEAAAEYESETPTPPSFLLLVAAASALVETGEIEDLDETRVIGGTRALGFEIGTHDEIRIVLVLCQRFVEKRKAHLEERARTPVQNFDATFFRDRTGRLMGRFSIGLITSDPIPMDEEWEQKFVLSYHDSLQLALIARS